MTVGDKKFCLHCDYPLDHLPARRCPECGIEFDPIDKSTMSNGPVGRLPRRLVNIRPRFILLLTIAFLLFQFWWQRYPSPLTLEEQRWISIPQICLLVTWCICWAGLWLMALILDMPRSLWPKRGLRRGAWIWFLVPAMLYFSNVADQKQWPFQLAFKLSRPALDRFVAEAQASYPQIDWAPRRVGLFDIQGALATRNCVRVNLHGNISLAYSPTAKSKSDYWKEWWQFNVRPLDGDWYLTETNSVPEHRRLGKIQLASELWDQPDFRPHVREMIVQFLAEGGWAREEFSEFRGDTFIESNTEYFESVPQTTALVTRYGKATVPALIDALRTGKSPSRRFISALALIGPDAAEGAEVIAASLASADPLECETAAWALRQIGPAAVAGPRAAVVIPALLKVVGHPNRRARYNVALALESLAADRPEIIPVLVDEWLKDAAAARSTMSAANEDTLGSIATSKIWTNLLIRRGPAVAPWAARIAQGLTEANTYCIQNPATRAATNTNGFDINYAATLRGAEMLAAIGPAAREQAAALRTAMFAMVKERSPQLLQTQLRNNQKYDAAVLGEAIYKISPADSASIEALVAALLEARKQSTEPEVTRAREFVRTHHYAALLYVLDPGNTTIRSQIRADCLNSEDVNTHRWAITAAINLKLPGEHWHPALVNMILSKNVDDISFGLQAASQLADRSSALSTAIRKLLNTRNIGYDQAKLATYALVAVDPESADAAETFYRTNIVRGVLAPHELSFLNKLRGPAAKRLVELVIPFEMPECQNGAEALLQLGPAAESAIPAIRNRLRVSTNSSEIRTLLKALKAVGPAAREALPEIRSKLVMTEVQSEPLDCALEAIGSAGWDVETEKLVREHLNIKSEQYRVLFALAECGAGAASLLREYMHNTDKWIAQVASESYIQIAAKYPMPINEVQFAREHALHGLRGQALMHETGSPAEITAHMTRVVRGGGGDVGLAAQKLVELGAPNDETREALRRGANFWVNIRWRNACRDALTKLGG